jgi:hypothetical protein
MNLDGYLQIEIENSETCHEYQKQQRETDHDRDVQNHGKRSEMQHSPRQS